LTTYLLFAGAALVLVGLVVLIWRGWAALVRRSPDDEALERELAALNDAQANRVSDQQLTRPVDPDTAWRTMVQRGERRRQDRRGRGRGR
jgi:hypothetical protein